MVPRGARLGGGGGWAAKMGEIPRPDLGGLDKYRLRFEYGPGVKWLPNRTPRAVRSHKLQNGKTSAAEKIGVS